MVLTTISSGSNGNCYLLDFNGKTIVLDCGLKFENITKHNMFPKFSKISFVWVSHSHGDHNKSMKEFALSGCEMLTYEMLEPKMQRWFIDDFEIITFPVRHNVPNFGIIIKHKVTHETFCYVTDFNAMPKIEGIQNWLIEVNYVEGYIDKMIEENKELKSYGFNNHNSLEKTIEYFSSLKTEPLSITCCHLSKSNSLPNKILKELSKFCEKVSIAKGE